MPAGLASKLEPYVVQVARPANGKLRIFSSGYLVSPRKIVTALHSVLDTDQFKQVPTDPVTCAVTTVADITLRNPSRSWDPTLVADDIDTMGTGESIWREAKLIWPLPGASTRRLDLAVLEVEAKDCTVTMQSAPQVAFFVPTDGVCCVGFGFPTWRQKRLPKGQLLAELHSVKGMLDPTRRLTDTMNDFKVQNGSPPADQANGIDSPWGGLSGAVLFDEESGLAVGIIGRWESSFDLSVLGITPVGALADSDRFWVSAGLPKPIRSTAEIRNFAIASKRARELVYLMDRTKQLTQFDETVKSQIGMGESASAANAQAAVRKWAPIISVVVSRPRDEPAELIRRLERLLGSVHPSRRYSYMALPRLNFPKSVDDVERAYGAIVSEFAKKLDLQEAAKQFQSTAASDIMTIISEFKRVLGDGMMARAFQIELSLDVVRPATIDILARLLAIWATFDGFDTPIVLFIQLLTRDYNKDETVDDRVEPFLSELEIRTQALAPKPIWVRLPVLDDCDVEDLDNWTEDLAKESYQVPFGFRNDIRRHLDKILNKSSDTFALRDFLYALENLRV
jgi:hypothetical protein